MGIEGPSTEARALAVAITSGQAEDFSERWAAWQAREVAHERATRRTVAIALPILIVVATIAAYLLLGR